MVTIPQNSGIEACNTEDSESVYDTPVPDAVIGTLWKTTDSPISPVQIDAEDIPEEPVFPEREQTVIDEQFIATLKTAAETIKSSLTSDLPHKIRENLDQWCSLHNLDGIESEECQTAIARQAVLNLVLKASLYEYYARDRDLPSLTTDAREKLQHPVSGVENAGFDETVLDSIVWHAEESNLVPVLEYRDRLLRSMNPAEDIGELYAALLPSECRPPLGQYRTPSDIGSLMKRWVSAGGDTLLDPGMGAGVLSSPVHPELRTSGDPGYVTGVERSHLSRLMGTTALTLAGQPHSPWAKDFLGLLPEDLPNDVDAIVCNPPYTRSLDIPKGYQEAINAQATRETGLDISKRSPLYTYFIYHLQRFLSIGDRAAVITPQAFLSASYGDELKEFLLSEFDVKALVQYNPANGSVFDDANTTALVTFLEKNATGSDPGATQFIRVDEPPSSSALREAVDTGKPGETDWGFINAVEQCDLMAEDNWQALFHPVAVDTSDLATLGEFVSVHRGRTIGKVDFFCLSESKVEEHSLSEEYLSRMARKGSHIDGYEFSIEDWNENRAGGREVWLLDPDEQETLPATPEEIIPTAVDSEPPVRQKADTNDDISNLWSYLVTGVKEYDLDDTGAVQNRPLWYRPPRQDPTSVLVEFATRDEVRFIWLEDPEIRYSNNLYGFYDVDLTTTELKALLAYLNSNYARHVAQTSPKLAGGYSNLRPKLIEDIPVVDPTDLPSDTVAALAEAFDDMRETDGRDDEILDRIDAILRTVR